MTLPTCKVWGCAYAVNNTCIYCGSYRPKFINYKVKKEIITVTDQLETLIDAEHRRQEAMTAPNFTCPWNTYFDLVLNLGRLKGFLKYFPTSLMDGETRESLKEIINGFEKAMKEMEVKRD